MNRELQEVIAQWDCDPLLFESDQLLRRLMVLDLLDRHLSVNWLSASRLASASAIEAEEIQHRANALQARLEAANERIYENIREEIRHGNQPGALLYWTGLARKEDSAHQLEENAYGFLDELISGVLRFEEPSEVPTQTDLEVVAYQPTPARHIFDLIDSAQLSAEDVAVDLGSGFGHVPLLISMCTPACSIGIEREPAYVEQAMRCVDRLNLSRVEFVQQDVRDADLSSGTVFYLYTPFTGSILRAVLDRLREQSRVRPIRVCSYGPCTLVLAKEPWLETKAEPGPQRIASFWPRVTP